LKKSQKRPPSSKVTEGGYIILHEKTVGSGEKGGISKQHNISGKSSGKARLRLPPKITPSAFATGRRGKVNLEKKENLCR